MDPESLYPAPQAGFVDVAARTAEPEAAAADLWSLPVETGARAGDGDGVMAAWMSVLGDVGPQEEAACRAVPGGSVPAGTQGPPEGPSRAAAVRRGRGGWAGPVVAVGVSVLVGVATLAVITQLTARGVGAPAGVSSAPDDRVMVPGPNAGCVTMLVKPLADGSTAHVAGTCFSVG